MQVMDKIDELLGDEGRELLAYTAKGFPRDRLHLPGPDFVDRVMAQSDRSPAVLRSFSAITGQGEHILRRLVGASFCSTWSLRDEVGRAEARPYRRALPEGRLPPLRMLLS